MVCTLTLTGVYLAPRNDFNDYKKEFWSFNPTRNMNVQNWLIGDIQILLGNQQKQMKIRINFNGNLA
jgi:hypothetical protein